MGKVFGVMVLLSCVFGAVNGEMEAVAAACAEGAGRAVELSISLLGMICLWNGVMAVLEERGAISVLSRLMSPLLRRVFPESAGDRETRYAISASVSANLLGIGNASTPLAVRAMEKMAELRGGNDRAGDDMVVFTVLGCLSPSLLPTTVIALRQAAGAADPFSILPWVWAIGAVMIPISVLLCRVGALMGRRQG